MKISTINYNNPKQGYLPLFLSDCLDMLDPVLTFDRLMGGIDLNKYLTDIPEYTTGRLRYNPVNMLKTVLFGFMISSYCSLRELEDNCKVNIRFMYLMDHQTPSYRTFGYFINEVLQDKIENIFNDINQAIFNEEHVDLQHIYIDGSKFEANANKYTWVWKKATEKFRYKLYEKITGEIEEINKEIAWSGVQISTNSEYVPDYLNEIIDQLKLLLLIEDDSNYIWHIKNFLQRKGYHVLVAFTVSQGKELIEKEQILIIGSDLKLSDGSGMELLEYLREKTYKIPFLFFTCYDKKYYEKEALEKGAKICMNKLQFDLVKETLLEYAYKESNGEGATFHKILLVKKNSEITSIIQTELLKKGIYMIMVETIWEAEDKLLECQDIELILCDLFLQDGIAMDFFHSMKKLAGIYQNTKEPIFRELPFFIFTDNKDLSLEYQYRHEGVSDYITSPVNIPELIRRICYFVEE